jgi:hypothetical protein
MYNIKLVSAADYIRELFNNKKDKSSGAWNGMPVARVDNSIFKRDNMSVFEYLSGVQAFKYPSGMFFVSPKNDHLEMAEKYVKSENKDHFMVYCEINNPVELTKTYYVYMLLSDYLIIHDPLKPYIQDILLGDWNSEVCE